VVNSFLRSAWERTPGRSASRPVESVFVAVFNARDAERRKSRSHAERGNECAFVISFLRSAWERVDVLSPLRGCGW